MPQLKLKDVRLAFPDLFEAKQYQGAGPFRYSATFLVVPGSENDKLIRAAIKEAAAEKFGKKADAIVKGIESNSNKFCYIDGNTKDYDGYEGMFYLAAHRKQDSGRVGVFDRKAGPDGKPAPLIAADGKPYAGCYVNATVDIYAQDGQNSGIRAGLIGVQFFKDGDSFSGARVASADDFDAIEEGADAEDIT